MMPFFAISAAVSKDKPSGERVIGVRQWGGKAPSQEAAVGHFLIRLQDDEPDFVVLTHAAQEVPTEATNRGEQAENLGSEELR